MEPNQLSFLIGTRIQSARKSAGLTQAELSGKLNFKDRQILSNIESGTRKTSADELVKLIRLLNKPLEYFTDPYLLTDPDAFHWRASAHADPSLFESKAGKIAMAHLRFCDLLGETINPIASHLSLTPHPSPEEITEKTEKLILTHNLGDYPAEKLSNLIERLNFQILFIDPPTQKGAPLTPGLSSAVCHLTRMNFIFLNRQNHQTQRHFELAHQLFHLLTWHFLKPDPIDRFTPSTDPNDISYLPYDYGDPGKRPRIERLADHFAVTLLMPEKSVLRLWDARPASSKLKNFIIESSGLFQVPASIMKFRMKELDLISPSESAALPDEVLKTTQKKGDLPKPYSPKFVSLLHEVLKKGHLSAKKASELLDITEEGLKSVLRSHGFKP